MSKQNIAHEIGSYLVDTLRKELAMQGHKLTGTLIKSIEYRIEEKSNSTFVHIFFEKYGIYMESGVEASRIPYRRSKGGRSGKKSKYIEALIRYARLRMGVSRKKAEGIAFAIATAHSREGMPTRGSYKYSKNSRRTGWLSHTMENSEARLSSMVDLWIEFQLDQLVTSFVNKK